MKKLLTLLLSIVCVYSAQANLILTAVYDGPLSGGLPKGVELYVTADIPDLSLYGLGSATNGSGTNGQEFTFPADAATAGTFIYVTTDSTGFADYFGFSADYIDGQAVSINGDDAMEVFQNGAVIDVFGDINTDGSGQSWDYENSWAYRMDNTGPDGTIFVESNWTIPGVNALSGNTNAEATTPMPIGTFEYTAPADPLVAFVGTQQSVNEDAGTITVDVAIISPNDNPTTVEVNLGAGSTADAADFSYTNTTLTFPANDNTMQSVTVTITDDMMEEMTETIVLELANPTNNASLAAASTFTINILDNDTPIPNLVINEFNFNSPSIDSLEYIEIYNNDTVTIDLIGFSLSNALDHTFATATPLAPGEYLVVAGDADAMFNAYGVEAIQWQNGGLNNGGETIVLNDAAGNVVDEVSYDSDIFPSIVDGGGSSAELCDPNEDNNDPNNWFAANTNAGFDINGDVIFGTPGAANTVSCLAFIPVEIGFDDPYPFGTELVAEDAGMLSIDVVLSQGSDAPSTVMIDLVSSTATNGMDFNFTPFTHTFDDSLEMDTVSFTIEIIDDMEEEIVENLVINMTSMDTMVELQDTLLIINIADNDGMADSLVITEIMYNLPGSDDFEFVEIYNNSQNTIDLAGASFQDGIFHQFEAGSTINAGEYLVLTNDSTAFADAFGVSAIEWTAGGLNNSGEQITLYDNSGMLADEVNYDDASPFPSAADGNGPSLELCDVNEDNDNGINWFAATTSVMVDTVELFATPGAANTAVCLGDNPLISLSSANSSFMEDAGSGFVTVEITNGNDNPTTVTFTVEASSTADDADYTLSSSTITFPAGTMSAQQSLEINIIDDEEIEDDETIVLTITADNGAVLGDITMHTMTITDNDDDVSNHNIFAGKVDVFPNPAQDYIQLNTAITLDNIRLVNLVGQTVAEQNNISNSTQFSVNQLPKGIYFLQMTSGKESHTQQIVVE